MKLRLYFCHGGFTTTVPPNHWIKVIVGKNFKFANELQDKDIHRILFNLVDMMVHDIEMGLEIIPLDCHAETPESDEFKQLKPWTTDYGEGNAILVNFREEIFS